MKNQPCVFCGTSPINREHAFPDWISKEIEGITGYTMKRDDKPAWTSKKLKLSVHAPCEFCNGGWMSALEVRARPMLVPAFRGERVTYDRWAQQLLSLWVAKTCMMLDLTVSAPPFFAPEDYRWLAVHRQPPRGARVSLIAIKRPSHTGSYYRSVVPRTTVPLDSTPKGKTPDAKAGTTYCLTVQLGNFVGQLLGDTEFAVEAFRYNNDARRVVVPFWPLGEDVEVVWPGEGALTDGAALESFAYMPIIPPPSEP